MKSEAELIESWTEEKQSAFLYRIIAEYFKGYPNENLFATLGKKAEEQALYWEASAKKQNLTLPPFRPNFRAKIAKVLIRSIGPQSIRHMLTSLKVRGLSTLDQPGHPTPKSLSDVGKRHRTSAFGNNLRAGVFGINDGLVSNAALIIGISGAGQSHELVMMTGIAGLLAGSLSMGAGEYISVCTQRELLEHQIELERAELAEYPEEEASELALIYEAKGFTPEQARDVSNKLVQTPELALSTLVREELGLNPDELYSPFQAGLASFFAFCIGSALPLIPYIFPIQGAPMRTSLAITGLSLFSTGMLMSLFSGRNMFWSGFRMLLVGSLACAATFFIGQFFGTVLS